MKGKSAGSLLLLAGAFFLVPLGASASVTITEIMYDAEGADTKHEWVEVMNSGSAVDITDWKLFEGGSNHKLTLFSGTATVPQGGYAIIADDPVTFLADFPSFSGMVFDTALSGGLTNSSGESLTLRDGNLSDVSSVIYDPTLGAAGDGNTLQKVGSNWQALPPTPGAAAGSSGSSGDPSPDPEPEPETAPPAASAENQATGGAPVVPQIRATAGEDRTVVAGASTVFSGNATGLTGSPLQGARYVWSFGNGDTREGQSVLYAYPYPGKYAVTLDVTSSGWGATDRILVTVVDADVAITGANAEYTEIENRSSRELDLGLWQLSAGGKTFIFPPHTVLLPKSVVRVSNAATGLLITKPSDVALLYPNGAPVAAYAPKLITYAPRPDAPQVAARTPVPADVPFSVEGEPLQDARDELLASAGVAEAPVPYWVWYAGLVALIGGAGAAAHFIRKGFPQS